MNIAANNMVVMRALPTGQPRLMATLALEVRGQPEKVEPPHRIGHELADDEGPDFPVTQQRSPRHLDGFFDGRKTRLYVLELGLAEPRLLFGGVEEPLPEVQPYQADDADEHEGALPAPVPGNPHREE